MLKNKYGQYIDHVNKQKQLKQLVAFNSHSNISKHIKDMEIIKHNTRLYNLVNSIDILKGVKND